jgi:serine/threonine protein kinase
VHRIGRFSILRELGHGSIGSVYLGHDPVIDRSVAIKTINPRLSAPEKRRYEQHFINEARAAGRLSHPNIVTIFDASSEGGTIYIAMEYLEGRELAGLLDSGHRYAPEEIAAIVGKVAGALDYAHRNQVIHRDIKPANIFMMADGEPKVVDFGIARAPNRLPSQSDAGAAPFTLFHNNLLGTPCYMSPEQALGRPADARTDVYSLGAVMYEMLTGSKPFQARDTAQLLQSVAYKNPRPPHMLDAAIPLPLSEIVMKAMSKRAEKRYQTAREMARDLQRYLVMEKRGRRLLKKESAVARQAAAGPLRHGRRMLYQAGGLAALGMIAIAGLQLMLRWRGA